MYTCNLSNKQASSQIKKTDGWLPEVGVRQAGTWDPLLHCLHLHRIQRNSKGLKITVCMCTWGKLGTTRYKKDQNPTATSEDLRAKAGYCTCPLHTATPRR